LAHIGNYFWMWGYFNRHEKPVSPETIAPAPTETQSNNQNFIFPPASARKYIKYYCCGRGQNHMNRTSFLVRRGQRCSMQGITILNKEKLLGRRAMQFHVIDSFTKCASQ